MVNDFFEQSLMRFLLALTGLGDLHEALSCCCGERIHANAEGEEK